MIEGDSPDGQIVPVPVVPQQPVLIRQQTPSPSQLALSSPNILDSYSRKVSKLRSLNKRHLNHIRSLKTIQSKLEARLEKAEAETNNLSLQHRCIDDSKRRRHGASFVQSAMVALRRTAASSSLRGTACFINNKVSLNTIRSW